MNRNRVRQRGRTKCLLWIIAAAELRSARWAWQSAGRMVMGVASRLYYLRYDLIASWLGLPARLETGPGLLLIQVDALSYEHLHEAMRRGYAPYLARLLGSGQFRVQEWRCGLPSATPAVQAGIMYGDNYDIPAFRWYDKVAGREVVCKTPALLGQIQRRLSAGHRGLLHGGSSYVNLFSGGASLSLFALASFREHRSDATMAPVVEDGAEAETTRDEPGGHRYFEHASGDRLAHVFLFSPVRLTRMVVLAAWEYGLHQAQTALVRLRRRDRVETRAFGLIRIISNVLFKELQTFACMVDAYRGVPRMMTDYNGYDEMAHHFGPSSSAAMLEVRSIDRRIRGIDRIRRYSPFRAYDLYIFSDHGQSSSRPFRQLYGQTLQGYAHQLAGEPLPPEIGQLDHFDAEYIASYILDELRPLLHASEASWVRQRVVGFLVARLEQTLSKRGKSHQPGPLRLFVSHSSALANVYINQRLDHVPLEEIEALYPALVEGLIGHPGIEVVIGRYASGDTLIAGKAGRVTLTPGGAVLVGTHPLARLEDPEVATQQVHELASYPSSGDLIIFSALLEGGRVINFEEQLGGHGALGGPQARPFMMHQAEVPLDLTDVTNARHLYALFMERYGGRGDDGARPGDPGTGVASPAEPAGIRQLG